MIFFKRFYLFCIFIGLITNVFGQGSFERLGTQAFMKSNFKAAVGQLEKADKATPNNANVLKMLGYSYFQCGDFDNAIAVYSRLIALKPTDYSAYYYRGKARLNIANTPKEALSHMRESFYTASIKDFTKAIEISGEEDAQILQNRGIAYKDYGIFKSYKARKLVEKKACVGMMNNAIADFQRILMVQPGRKDIPVLIDYVKAQIASLK